MKNKLRPMDSVIVRAWGNEPVRLFLYSIDNKRHIALVGGDGCRRPIGIPISEAFVFDESVFVRLRAAFETGNTPELLNIYAHLEKIAETGRGTTR